MENLLSCDFFMDFISIMALVVSIFSYLSVRKLNKAQFELIEKKKIPNLQVQKIIYEKNNSNEISANNGCHCRICYGESIINESLDGKIPLISVEDLNLIEPGFIDEIKNTIGKNVYFTYFSERPYLIINHASNKDNFIIDYSNVKIFLHNYGAKISALSVTSFTIFFKSGMNISELKLEGINNKIIITPQDNDELILYFDEITTNLNNSMCKLPKTFYDTIPNSIDLLRTRMTDNLLNYDKLEIGLICWDMYNTPIEYLITIQYIGSFFISTTTIV